MLRKGMVIGVGAAVVLTLLAPPAVANKAQPKQPHNEVPNPLPAKDVGLLDGEVKVGKARDGCSNDGKGNVTGGGLGLPGVTTPKNAYYQFTGSVTSLVNRDMALTEVCGRLTKQHSAVGNGLGAACGASKGWDGKGKVSWEGLPGKQSLWLQDVGWKFTVGGLIFVTGKVVAAGSSAEAKTKQSQDHLLALLLAQGGAECFNKRDAVPPPAGTGEKQEGVGATRFTIIGIYGVLNGPPPDRNAGFQCKFGPEHGCLNRPKKQGGSG
ncbi:MAG TPA: hypothetical protein VNU01_02470 [Egibacteraceae bacterium]|nr:hypothetical protein [Egibacteraceae bacterium]